MVAEVGPTICLVWGCLVILVSSLGYIQLWRYYSTHKPRSPNEASEHTPHVTIIRPVKGLDPGLYDCLVSTFQQSYPSDRLTVHFCVDSRHDLALPVLERLLEDFPDADARIFIEDADPALQANNGTSLGPNPKIRSMSRAYREAQGDIIWIVDCNVWVAKGVCGRMVDAILGRGEGAQPQKLVHQIPLVVDTDILSAPETHHILNAEQSDVQIASTSTRATETRNLHNSSTYATKGGRLEEMFMSTSHAKFYTAINTVLVAPCLVGKSNMFRRSHLNALTNNKGIDYFSHNICEDHLIGDLLWKQPVPAHLLEDTRQRWGNHALVFGDLAVQPMAHMSVGEYVARRVRWLRVRKYTVPAATLVEPTTESFFCSLMLSYGLTTHSFMRSTFDIPPTWTAFAICWSLCISIWAFHYIHPRYLKWFFDAKTIICLPAVFALLGWACHVSGGGLHSALMEQKTSLSGSAYSWAFLNGLNSMLGNYGTMAVNINDFARYAKSTKMIYGQILVIPLSFMLMSFMGVIIAGAASDLYGESIWDPLTIMSHWNGSSGARAAAAFVSLSFVLAQLGSNISANCVSAANDLNAMFPAYVNLRRGSYIIAFVGAWALTPWNILSSASALLNFMDGYIIWLAPITGVLLADYYVVHRQTYDVEEIYIPGGKYQYNNYGTNWRAVTAWFAGCLPLIGGFAAAMNSSLSVSSGAIHLYKLGYLYGFFSSFVLYSALSIIFPPTATFVYGSEEEETAVDGKAS